MNQLVMALRAIMAPGILAKPDRKDIDWSKMKCTCFGRMLSMVLRK